MTLPQRTTRGDAVFSADSKYRYRLHRTWDAGAASVLFVMLNPSTADATQDDPTIRRCVGFAKRWGYGRLLVGNLFALRATDPRCLLDEPDPVGPQNDEHLRVMMDEARIVICAWGAHKLAHGTTRESAVKALLGPSLWALGRTAAGAPRHPLYMPKDAGPVRL